MWLLIKNAEFIGTPFTDIKKYVVTEEVGVDLTRFHAKGSDGTSTMSEQNIWRVRAHQREITKRKRHVVHALFQSLSKLGRGAVLNIANGSQFY